MKKSEEMKIHAEIIARFEETIDIIKDNSDNGCSTYFGDAIIRPENADEAIALFWNVIKKCL